MTLKSQLFWTSSVLTACLLAGCSSGGSTDGGKGGSSAGGNASGGAASGGSPGTGGGSAQGGASHGGSASGGSGNGGSSSGGSGNSGSSNGGSSNGGAAQGGKTSNGGSSNGGSSNGGSSNGGSSSGGAGGTQAGAGGATAGSTGTGFTCPNVAAGTNPLPSNTTPMVVTGVPPADSFNNNNNDFKILEGPVWFQDALYLSEIKNGSAPPPSRVLKVTSTGTVSIAIPPNNAGTNGLAIDAGGKLIGANHTLGAIVRLDPTGATAPMPIVSMFMNQRFNSPNDLTARADGNIYFTDPQHQAGSTKMDTRVYRIAPNASTATSIENSNAPNGITLSIDGNTLFVSHGPDSGGIDKFPLNPDGSTGTKAQLTSSFNSDGMAIDCAGNLYLSNSNKIVVISSTTGQKVGEIPVSDVQAATNVAFGGPEHKTLYITSLGNNAKLLKLELNVPGMPY